MYISSVQSVGRSSAPAVIPAGASASSRPSHRLDEVYGRAATDVSLASSRMWWLYARQRYPFPAGRLHAHGRRCQLAELYASGRASGGDWAGEQGSSPAGGVDGGADRAAGAGSTAVDHVRVEWRQPRPSADVGIDFCRSVVVDCRV